MAWAGLGACKALGAHGLPSRGRRAVLAAAGSQACCRADGPGPLEGSTRPAARAERTAPTSSPQQPCGAGCSGTVPFTAKRTITGISPGRFHNNPPQKEGGGVKKKGRAFSLFSFPPNPAFNQKNKAWYFVCRLGKHKSNFNNPSQFT